jgi:hypothetical protein
MLQQEQMPVLAEEAKQAVQQLLSNACEKTVASADS